MKIVIETIPHDQHRYPTIGDWWRDPDGTLQIRVSEFPKHWSRGAVIAAKHEFLIALHELIEVTLCEDRGITEARVTTFDLQHTAPDDPWVDDPGLCPDAPYHQEHVFAECIERLVAQQLGVNWQDYERACLALDGKTP